MTQKFKDAVAAAVIDGIITDSEREHLRKVAKAEGVPELDAETYIMSEFKKIRAKQQSPHWLGTAGKIGTGLITGIGTILSILSYLDDKEEKKHKRELDKRKKN